MNYPTNQTYTNNPSITSRWERTHHLINLITNRWPPRRRLRASADYTATRWRLRASSDYTATRWRLRANADYNIRKNIWNTIIWHILDNFSRIIIQYEVCVFSFNMRYMLIYNMRYAYYHSIWHIHVIIQYEICILSFNLTYSCFYTIWDMHIIIQYDIFMLL